MSGDFCPLKMDQFLKKKYYNLFIYLSQFSYNIISYKTYLISSYHISLNILNDKKPMLQRRPEVGRARWWSFQRPQLFFFSMKTCEIICEKVILILWKSDVFQLGVDQRPFLLVSNVPVMKGHSCLLMLISQLRATPARGSSNQRKRHSGGAAKRAAQGIVSP